MQNSSMPTSTTLLAFATPMRLMNSRTAAGGTPYINRVGHAFFKTRMRKEGSLFGGEVSGHYYFRDFYCADSGTIPALLVLELLCASGKTMAELLAPFHEPPGRAALRRLQG